MPRPKKCRKICHKSDISGFKPIGIPINNLEIVILNDDELEAVRLADLFNKKQEDAANEMRISRQTFGRIINSAHFKIADALINNKTLIINKQADGFNNQDIINENFNNSENFSKYKKGWKHGKSFKGLSI